MPAEFTDWRLVQILLGHASELDDILAAAANVVSLEGVNGKWQGGVKPLGDLLCPIADELLADPPGLMADGDPRVLCHAAGRDWLKLSTLIPVIRSVLELLVLLQK